MARRNLASIEDYERALRKGYGVGAFKTYRPWIRVVDVPSIGLSSKSKSVTVGRLHETLSGIETSFFHLADFAPFVVDIREQFPLIPVNCLQETARRLNIKYPIVKKTKAPVILTTDFLLTICNNGRLSHQAYAVKPSSELRKSRVRQLLEIERVWWTSLNIPWQLVTKECISESMIDNLIWLSKNINNAADLDLPPADLASEHLSKILPARIYTISKLIEAIQDALEIEDPAEAKALISICIWRRLLSINLMNPILKTGLIEIIKWNLPIQGEIWSDSYGNLA